MMRSRSCRDASSKKRGGCSSYRADSTRRLLVHDEEASRLAQPLSSTAEEQIWGTPDRFSSEPFAVGNEATSPRTSVSWQPQKLTMNEGVLSEGVPDARGILNATREQLDGEPSSSSGSRAAPMCHMPSAAGEQIHHYTRSMCEVITSRPDPSGLQSDSRVDDPKPPAANSALRPTLNSRNENTSKPPVSPTTDSEALRLWNAFESKHDSIMARLAEASQLRRQCMDIRHRVGQKRTRLQAGASRAGRSHPIDTIRETADDEAELRDSEKQLDSLDEQLLLDFDELRHAAPRVLSRMRKRLPIMLEKHQLDFRGDASTSSYASSLALEDELDETATALLAKQLQLDALEDRILSLRHKRDREAQYLAFDSPDADSDDDNVPGRQAGSHSHMRLPSGARTGRDIAEATERQDFINNLSTEISIAVEELRVLKDELEQALNMPRPPEKEPSRAAKATPGIPDHDAARPTPIFRTNLSNRVAAIDR